MVKALFGILGPHRLRGGPILGMCTYASTLILVVLGIFWLHGPNFDQISQIPSVTSYLGPKNASHGQKWSSLEISNF